MEQSAVNEAVQKFLQANIIEISPTQSTEFLSNFFTIQETTKRRPILDCQVINKYIQCHHFKMEGVPALRDIIEKNDYICKLDLKDAYVVTPIHKDSRKYLTFQNQGIVYQYKTLAFGMSVSPRVFSKLMRFAMEYVRKQGIRLVYYLDDVCILGSTKEEALQHTNRVMHHLEKLGFLINQEKSVLTPLQQQEFLGFSFNTKNMKISVPLKKIKKLLSRIKQAITATIPYSCRWYAALLGKMTSMIPAIGEALLHIRHMQRDLSSTLRHRQQNWDTPMTLSQNSIKELEWWKQWITTKNGLPIQKIATWSTPQLIIHVDASDLGWGVSSMELNATGPWTSKEKDLSINARELTAIYFALKLHAKKYQNSRIKIFTDNMTALKYSTKSGGTASRILQDLAVSIQEISNQFNLEVEFQHVPGKDNIHADWLSRQQHDQSPLYKAQLPRQIFQQLNKNWGPLKLDVFADRVNTQLPRFWSLQPDPEAEAMDAFQQQWPKKGIYLFPPWKLIPHRSYNS